MEWRPGRLTRSQASLSVACAMKTCLEAAVACRALQAAQDAFGQGRLPVDEEIDRLVVPNDQPRLDHQGQVRVRLQRVVDLGGAQRQEIEAAERQHAEQRRVLAGRHHAQAVGAQDLRVAPVGARTGAEGPQIAQIAHAAKTRQVGPTHQQQSVLIDAPEQVEAHRQELRLARRRAAAPQHVDLAGRQHAAVALAHHAAPADPLDVRLARRAAALAQRQPQHLGVVAGHVGGLDERGIRHPPGRLGGRRGGQDQCQQPATPPGQAPNEAQQQSSPLSHVPPVAVSKAGSWGRPAKPNRGDLGSGARHNPPARSTPG